MTLSIIPSTIAATTKVGGMRRKTKRISTQSVHNLNENKLHTVLQKLGVNAVPAIEEAFLMTDGCVYRLHDAKVSVSMQANTCVIRAQTITTEGMNAAAAAVTTEEMVEEKGPKEQTEEEAAVEMRENSEDSTDMHKPNRTEKKVRKTLGSSFAFKATPEGHTEMRVCTSKGIKMVIQRPDVLKVSSKDAATFACFGKIDVQDLSTSAARAQTLMEQLNLKGSHPTAAENMTEDSDDEDCPDLAQLTFDEQPLGAGWC